MYKIVLMGRDGEINRELPDSYTLEEAVAMVDTMQVLLLLENSNLTADMRKMRDET